MNSLKILTESITPAEGNIITESVDNGKDMFLHGIFMQAEIENRNKRKYPLSEMVNAVTSLNEQIQSYGGIFGELDHPSSRLNIALDRISHVITEIHMDGNNAVGRAKLLNTPVGLIAKELAKSGVKYGVSSRGAGELNESGVVSNFKIVTIDLVATPSAAGAVPNTIYEGLVETKIGNSVMSLAEALKQDETAQKYFKNSIQKFIKDVLKQ